MDAYDEMIASQTGDEPRVDGLVQEIAKLRKQLAAAEALSVTKILKCVDPDRDVYFRSVAEVVDKLSELFAEVEDYELGIKVALCMQEKLEAAEAKLKVLDEQEPVAWSWIDEKSGDAMTTGAHCYEEKKFVQLGIKAFPLFARPVPPADTHWLRIEFEEGYPEDVAFGDERQMSRLKKWLYKFYAQKATIAELERKLAEQQSIVSFMAGHVREDKDYLQERGFQELNTLIAQAKEEGRKEAVPEGWQVVPVDPANCMLDALGYLWGSTQHVQALRDYKAMLAASPNPKEKL